MAKKEKFGKFVLLDEIGSSVLGTEYRAAKLSATGLEKIVTVLRLSSAISGNADIAKALMEQAKIAAQLQNPNIVKIYGIGKVEAAYYISFEYIEGKSLKAVFARCRQDGFPFSVDHTLLISSKICSALEYAHSRRGDSGSRYFHGLLTPSSAVVSYEGEVRVHGFGYWPGRVREVNLAEDDLSYLAPEQFTGGTGDPRSDAFAVGAILFEALTGRRLFEAGRNLDIKSRLAQAKLHSPSGEEEPLPRPIADILHKTLAIDPASRYGEIQELRKAIDTLLFSGDFTPTTFNLAFFMHSLFREDIEREAKTLKEEKDASYFEFLTEEPAKAGVKVPSAATVTPLPIPVMPTPIPPVAVAPPVTTPAALPLIPPPPRVEPPVHRAEAPREMIHAAEPEPHHVAFAPEPVPGLSPKEAAASFTFHKAEAKSRTPLLIGIGVIAIAAAVGGYLAYGRKSAPPPPPSTQLPPEALAAIQRTRELEAKLQEMEAEKAAAEQKAKDEAAAKLKREAAAKGQQVDPAALQKAQAEAAEKARAEQERKQLEERKRLEDEKRVADERAAAEKAAADEAARLAAASTTTTLAPPTTVAAIRPGTLVSLSDAGVTPPVVERAPRVDYPEMARRLGVQGTVEVNALIDEKGTVTEVQVVTGPPMLVDAASDNVKRRKYRPATKDGVPVKVWQKVNVDFRLGR